MVDVDDWADDENGKIDPEVLEERIDLLTEDRATCEQEGLKHEAEFAEELADLQGFRAEVLRATGAWDSVTIVAERDFVKHLRWCAEEYDGISSENVGDFVDWDRYAANQRHQWSEIMLGRTKTLVCDEA